MQPPGWRFFSSPTFPETRVFFCLALSFVYTRVYFIFHIIFPSGLSSQAAQGELVGCIKHFSERLFWKTWQRFWVKAPPSEWVLSLSLVIFFEFCKVFQYSFFCFTLFCFWEYQNILGWMLLAVAFSKAFLVKKVFL